MVDRPINKSIWSVIQRLMVGAIVYILWQERNIRLFQGKSRNIETVCDDIQEVVRLRLLSLKIKSSKSALDAAKIWKFKVTQSNVSNGPNKS